MEDFLSHAIKQFPEGINSAFAYGSGVFQQNNNTPAKDNMIDMIFIVDDPASWHRMNFQKYPNHYSFVAGLGPDFLAKIQCQYGAGVYFNTLVQFEDRTIKYGVISTNDLLDDLRNWRTLYISGRLHKPVLKSEGFIHGPIKHPYEYNLQSAINTSLMMLPESFNEVDLYLAITSLSYLGDFRMIFGEDRNKVQNIVLPNKDSFSSLFNDAIKISQHVVVNDSRYFQDVSATGRLNLLKLLPSNLQRKFMRHAKIDALDGSKKCNTLLEDGKKCSLLIKQSVGSIVRTSSISQSLKGIVTAGPSKSILYSFAKVRKMVKSLVK